MHYDQLTFPVPAVKLTIVSEPIVDVELVKPAPIDIVPAAVGYLIITIPLPPVPPEPEPPVLPPPPPPVFAVAEPPPA